MEEFLMRVSMKSGKIQRGGVSHKMDSNFMFGAMLK